MTGPLLTLGISLGLTLLLESLFFLMAGKRDRRDYLLLVLVNVLTNPPVVLVHSLIALYTSWSLVPVKLVLEVLAVLVEALCYQRHGETYRRPLLFSLGANAFSFGCGLLLQLIL